MRADVHSKVRSTGAAIRSVLSRLSYWKCKISGEKQISIEDYSIRVSISNYLGDYREVKFFEENEVHEMSDMLSEIKDEDILLDIGANIGIHSLFGSLIADQVISIEPHPVNASHLLINKWRNDSDIDLYQCAFSDTSGFTSISGPRGGFLADGSVALSQFDLPAKKGSQNSRENKIHVRTEVGDQFIKIEGINTPNIVKIDVEGAEEKVIDGLENTLSNPDCRILYCEIHQDRVEYDEIVPKIENMGFSVQVIDTRNYSQTIKAIK